jgi:hypothetical protein
MKCHNTGIIVVIHPIQCRWSYHLIIRCIIQSITKQICKQNYMNVDLILTELHTNLLEPNSYFMYHQLNGAHITFVCFVWISEQTAMFAFYCVKRQVLYNGGGQCLVHSNQWVLDIKQMHFILTGLICKCNTCCHYQSFKLNKPVIEWKLTVP